MAALNTLLLLLAALAIPGLINRTRALLAGRKGIRFAQHLYDVRLLLRKGAVYSPTTTAVFRAAPSVTLGTALVAALFVPVGDLPSALSFEGDLIAFAYLLALGRVALILAAMDTGSSFEGMGASREALYGALVEPALMLVFGTLALLSGYTSFDAIFSGDAVNGMQLVVVLLLAAYVLVKIVFTEAGRVPVDDPRTHLELTMIHEVMCLDYCGVDLAYIKMAGWLKTAALSVLAADAVAEANGMDELEGADAFLRELADEAVFRDFYPGADEDFRAMVRIAAAKPLRAFPASPIYEDSEHPNLLVNQDFYEAILADDWCWFWFNAYPFLQRYTNHRDFGAVPDLSTEPFLGLRLGALEATLDGLLTAEGREAAMNAQLAEDRKSVV